MHNHESIELKDSWMRSKNIQKLYFVTATFSPESKPYFSDSSNHYLLAKFHNDHDIFRDIETFNQEKTSFVFSINDDFFERESEGNMNFISIYYLEYGESDNDFLELADIIGKRDKVQVASLGRLSTMCKNQPKFTFPYGDSIVILEVTSEKSHQSVNKYCEKTRRDVNRKGLTLTNFMSLSILEQLK